MATVLEQNFTIYLPPFQSGKSNSKKNVRQEKVEQMIIVTPTWQTQPWYAMQCSIQCSMQCSLLLTPLPDLLVDPQGNKHPLVQNRKLILEAWKVTGNPLRWKEFQAMQPSLYPSQEDRALLKLQIGLK